MVINSYRCAHDTCVTANKKQKCTVIRTVNTGWISDSTQVPTGTGVIKKISDFLWWFIVQYLRRQGSPLKWRIFYIDASRNILFTIVNITNLSRPCFTVNSVKAGDHTKACVRIVVSYCSWVRITGTTADTSSRCCISIYRGFSLFVYQVYCFACW